MFVYAGHQSQTDCSSNGFGDFALVDGSQACQFGVFYATHIRHIVRHDGEVLIKAYGVDV